VDKPLTGTTITKLQLIALTMRPPKVAGRPYIVLCKGYVHGETVPATNPTGYTTLSAHRLADVGRNPGVLVAVAKPPTASGVASLIRHKW
jgi:hypothetical protein